MAGRRQAMESDRAARWRWPWGRRCWPRRSGRPPTTVTGGVAAAAAASTRVATFPVFENNADPGAETVAEIVAATADGKTLVYTDAVQGAVGFVDIHRPVDPPARRHRSTSAASPTSVAVLRAATRWSRSTPARRSPPERPAAGDRHRHPRRSSRRSTSAASPIRSRSAPTHRFLAIVIENERDEDVTVDGVEGGLPQTPPGYLVVIVDLQRPRRRAGVRQDVTLTGLADVRYPDDPEPEFVDINHAQPGGGDAAGEQPHRHRRPAQPQVVERLPGRRGRRSTGVDADRRPA